MTVCLDVSILIEKKNGKSLPLTLSLKIVIMANLNVL